MISIKELDREIRELEQSGKLSWEILERLSNLYTVRHHLTKKGDVGDIESMGIGFKPSQSTDEFKDKARHLKHEDLINLVDEHLAAIKDIVPDKYNRFMRRMEYMQ